MFSDKVLLITGGTGTFGNAVLRRFLATDIREIRVFSRDEKKQHDMRLAYNNRKLKFYIGDVRRPESLLDAMTGVDYVFHAAALKQVPSCEFYPMEALLTNSLGAENVMNAAVGRRRQTRGGAQHRQGRLPHQRHGHLQGDDGEAGRGQVARGRRPRLHDLPSPATAMSWPRVVR